MAVAAGAASVAFGCASVTSPYLNALEPNRGAVPASVVVSGGNWVANQNVNLVWAPTGESIGSAQTSGNGSFSTRVTIPASAETGKDYVHYVRATQGATTGNTPFGVDSPAEDKEFSVPAPAPVTYASTSGGDPNRKTNQTPAEETRTAPAPTGGSGGIPSRPAEADSTPVGDTGAPATVTNAEGAAPARTAAPTRQQSPNPATARAAAPSSPLVPSAPSVAAAPVTEEEATAAARSASGDLWSGFAQGPATVGAPSLTALPTTTSGTSPLAIGMGVLSAGLVALFAGFGVADMRRRRELATNR
ncbi:MAG TPA: hypothetical protein VM142_16185 [Acidimicrobiales bacterium]|nr:hypothetical protein [Acidimicrobiales bacterium]